MSALIDCLEFRPTATRRWLLVHHPDALMAEAEYSWTLNLEEATRFDDAQAEALKTSDALPLLPEAIVPIFVRVVHGHYEEPTLPPVRPAPQLLDERARRHREMIEQAEASGRHIAPAEAYERTCKLLGERD